MGEDSTETNHVLATSALRVPKLSRHDFVKSPRHPITVVLDGVQSHYNQGALFRLCDAFLVQRLIICGATVTPHNRRFTQAAAGTHHWVPWEIATDTRQAIHLLRQSGHWIVALELTQSVTPAELRPRFPAVVVIGGEAGGVAQNVLSLADQTIAIPMLGMANSLNVATAGAILLHQMTGHLVSRVDNQTNTTSPPGNQRAPTNTGGSM